METFLSNDVSEEVKFLTRDLQTRSKSLLTTLIIYTQPPLPAASEVPPRSETLPTFRSHPQQYLTSLYTKVTASPSPNRDQHSKSIERNRKYKSFDPYGTRGDAHLGAHLAPEEQYEEWRQPHEEQAKVEIKGATKKENSATPGYTSSKRSSRSASATLVKSG
ncbi:hypothetical protein PG996_015986 [Apiospora saccharicola]|uniref:Uncharacterized protein n=1 Tax=Apiospora saccharicola TaxID=335842 RepID=A0ABR1TMX4_9PEZI